MFLEVWKNDHIKDRSQENQSKHVWEVVFISNKMLTEEQGNVIGKPLNLDTDSFPNRKILCQCDSCEMSFNCLSEFVINKKNYLGKKINEFPCGKLLLSIKHEKIKEKSERFQNGKNVSHNKDLIQLQKIQTSEQNFEYNIYRETFLEKAVFDTYKREIPEGNDCEYDEYGQMFHDNSPFLFHQTAPSKENHYDFSDCGK